MIQVAIAGSSDEKLLPEAERKARAFARALPTDVVLLTGGRGGIMKVVSEEFSKRGGTVVGILPFRDKGNEFNAIRVRTGMDPVERSAVLVNSADVLVVLGGGVGTMIEALMAYNLGVPVVVLTGTGYRSDLLARLASDGYFDHKRNVRVYVTDDPEEAVELALRMAHMKTG
ncbi:TIGR00725 family protein [Pyrococcus yayanosii]|uniref:Oxidoreductase n=1 Tax=Pyrococcus yayanosii (strain CH1 / JCM 16557) TaxID=529709 RepID=F8AGT8_PYRYC|nr:TIGR00725 family protein [Pyrococcus yayanosii]AEH25224.1 oxidoreductase [Pyrococcus yayanosii CH1]